MNKPSKKQAEAGGKVVKRQVSFELHGVTCQKIALFIFISMSISNPT
jgi:hypothetical protein